MSKPVRQSALLEAIRAAVSRATVAPRVGPPVRSRAKKAASLRVLVAEDNAVNQVVAAGMLERAGHAAVLVRNGEEALEALARESFDAVLMDVQMPGLDGLQAAAAIRAREAKGEHVPIVAVTAHAAEGDAERCLAAGMDAYLAKPLQVHELLATLERLTGGARRRRKPSAAPDSVEPRGAPAVDRERLLERIGGDLAALRRLVRLFLEDSRKHVAGIRAALERGDAAAVRAAAHALKGAVANFAAPAAIAAALRVEKLGETSDLSRGPGALTALEHELQRVRRALSVYSRSPHPRRRAPGATRRRPRRRSKRRA